MPIINLIIVINLMKKKSLHNLINIIIAICIIGGVLFFLWKLFLNSGTALDNFLVDIFRVYWFFFISIPFNVMAESDSFLTWILGFILAVISAAAHYFIYWSYKILTSRKFRNNNNYD